MAKYEHRISGNFDHFLTEMTHTILGGSISATLEDSSRITLGDVHCATLVFERYSYVGSNRVSLNVTVLGQGNNLYISAISGQMTVLGDIADFEDVANAAYYLGSDLGKNVTGTEIVVDGGMTGQLYPRLLDRLLKERNG